MLFKVLIFQRIKILEEVSGLIRPESLVEIEFAAHVNH